MKVHFITRLSKMSHYETHAGPSQCAVECSQNNILYKLPTVIFSVVLDVPSQYPEGPEAGHPDTGFSWFLYVLEQMLGWFPFATTCFTCSRPYLNS